MANKKSFVLRIDEDAYKAIERWAADEFRSVNGQMEWILHQQLQATGRGKPAGKSNADRTKKKE